jgi:hypothetical protein
MRCRRAIPIFRSVLRNAVAIAAISACTESPTGTGAVAPPATNAPSAAFVVGPAIPGEYTWSQGQLGVNMGSATNKVCFLTRVQGKFRDVTESVGVGIVFGNWYLGGSSQQTGVSARARCIAASSYSGEVTGTTTSAITLPLTGTVCGLTGVGGKFTFSNDQVRIISSGGGWSLYVQNHSDRSTFGRARCITSPTSYTSGYSWQTGDGVKTLLASTSSVCFLTGMKDNFAGSASWVGVYKDTSWRMNGGASLTVNTAWASCAG